MAPRVYGNVTVAHARREELAADIAALVGIGVRAVRNRLEETHGKTRLRVAFEAEWPPPRVELARLTTSAALELDLVSEIAAVVDLTPRQVRGRLGRVDHVKTLVGTVFADEWPGEGDVDDTDDDEDDDVDDSEEDGTEADDEDVEDLEATSVADARRLDLAGAIADRTGLGVRKVRARLRGAHGNALVGNLFAEEWGAGDDEDDGKAARKRVTGTRVPPLREDRMDRRVGGARCGRRLAKREPSRADSRGSVLPHLGDAFSGALRSWRRRSPPPSIASCTTWHLAIL